MDEIEKRLRETSENCFNCYEVWQKSKKDAQADTTWSGINCAFHREFVLPPLPKLPAIHRKIAGHF